MFTKFAIISECVENLRFLLSKAKKRQPLVPLFFLTVTLVFTMDLVVANQLSKKTSHDSLHKQALTRTSARTAVKPELVRMGELTIFSRVVYTSYVEITNKQGETKKSKIEPNKTFTFTELPLGSYEIIAKTHSGQLVCNKSVVIKDELGEVFYVKSK